MPTLTKARTAQLCTDIRQLKLRAAAQPDGEFSLAAAFTREIGLEKLLFDLVLQLGSSEGALAVNEAQQYSPTAEEVRAYRAQRAAASAPLRPTSQVMPITAPPYPSQPATWPAGLPCLHSQQALGATARGAA